MAIVLKHKDKKQAIKQIKENGSLIVEKLVYVDYENNVIDIVGLRKKAIALETYKNRFKVVSAIAAILLITTITLLGVIYG